MEVARGQAAAALLDNEVLKEALDVIARRCLDRFAATDPREVDELAYCRRMLQAAADFKTYLHEAVQHGRNCAALIEHRERQEKIGRLNRGSNVN